MVGRREMLLGIFALAILSPACAFLCFSRDEDSDWTGIVPCSNSCYKIKTGVLGHTTVRKGCTDTLFETLCPGLDLGIAEAATCYCNSFLCNDSLGRSAFLPSFLLLLLPCLMRQLV